VDDPRRAGEERLQPSCPTLARGREHRQGVEKSDKLLPARGNWDASLTGFSKAMRRIRHELEADLGHEVPHWTLHDFRRTMATGLQRLSVRLSARQHEL